MPVPALLPTCRVSSSQWSWSSFRWHGCIPCPADSPRHRRCRSAGRCLLPCRPRSPAEVERSRFLPQTPLGARALPAELQTLAGAGTARRDLAEAAIPGCGSASGREGIKERKLQHLLVPSAVTPPRWRGARPPAPGCETFRGLAESARMRTGLQWRCPFQVVTVILPAPSGSSACQEHPVGREGVAGGRRGASLPRRFFPGWKPGPSDA